MPQPLPLRASLEWLKKTCKDRLVELRAADSGAKLSDAQRTVAREYGFASWRRLKSHVEQVQQAVEPLTAAVRLSTDRHVPADDPDLALLLAATEAGDLAAVTVLLGRRPELARAHGPDGQTALHVAAQCNDNRLAVYLLSCGADPEAKFGASGHTALSWAVTCNAFAFAQTLVRLGARPDLFCAAGIGALDHVREFFDETGVLRPGASRTGSSRFAPDGSRLPCPPLLPREQVSDALYIASRNAHVDVVRFLLSRAADVSFRAYMGATPLHWAWFGGSRGVIDLLLAAGADPTARDATLHCTPRAFGICAPANWGFAFLVRQRLAEDASLATINDGATSPLHEAARSGSMETVGLLLDAGADAALRNDQGKTPLEIAADSAHPGVVELLQRANGRLSRQSWTDGGDD
jgi:ankyrin repeat protein